MSLKPTQVDALLSNLCTTLGFCLPPSDQVALRTNPPRHPDDFTRAVFLAEGLDPATADRHLYRQVRDAVRTAFHDGAGLPSGVE
jgi:hypothetical protein